MEPGPKLQHTQLPTLHSRIVHAKEARLGATAQGLAGGVAIDSECAARLGLPHVLLVVRVLRAAAPSGGCHAKPQALPPGSAALKKAANRTAPGCCVQPPSGVCHARSQAWHPWECRL